MLALNGEFCDHDAIFSFQAISRGPSIRDVINDSFNVLLY